LPVDRHSTDVMTVRRVMAVVAVTRTRSLLGVQLPVRALGVLPVVPVGALEREATATASEASSESTAR
jgi:hypothetical protein